MVLATFILGLLRLAFDIAKFSKDHAQGTRKVKGKTASRIPTSWSNQESKESWLIFGVRILAMVGYFTALHFFGSDQISVNALAIFVLCEVFSFIIKSGPISRIDIVLVVLTVTWLGLFQVMVWLLPVIGKNIDLMGRIVNQR